MDIFDSDARLRVLVKKNMGGDLKISATSFDGKDLQSDWAGIFVRNARIQIIH